MDNLIENAVNQLKDNETDMFNKNVNKSRTQMNRFLGFCWEYDAVWQNTILTWAYTRFKQTPKKDKKVIQKCKNKRCVNPDHLVEVDHETWFKNSLDDDQLWMDVV
jgi:hypothetical protein